jgi:4-hydroxybenzoate polyprenyltransferase
MHPREIDMPSYDYLGMLRISDWIKFYMAMPIAGSLLAGASLPQIAYVSGIYFILIGFAFTVNNYFDVDIDRIHSGKVVSNKNPLATGSVSRRGVEVMMLAMVLIAMLSVKMSLIGFLVVILNLMLFVAYSGFLRLKERFALDIIAHGLMFGALPFLAGFALSGGRISPEIMVIALLFFILAEEALIAHQIVDYKEDLLSTRTTITIIGQRNGLILLGFHAAVSIAVLLFAASRNDLPILAAAIFGAYLIAYPAYSCRSLLQ